MSRPTRGVWADVKQRDGFRCIVCGRRDGLQFQHRLTVGMGGTKVKPRREEGLTACGICNEAFEGRLQTLALVCGWKVKRVKRAIEHPEDVPVMYPLDNSWFVLTDRGTRRQIKKTEALAMMREVYGEQYDEWREAA